MGVILLRKLATIWETVPSLDAAKKIAKAFGVTLDYLAGETSDMAFDRRAV
ncbi:hypothetical protein [Sphingobacterium detergens]